MTKLSVPCLHAVLTFLLLGNFLFENFLSVQVSIQTLKRAFDDNSLKVWILFDMSSVCIAFSIEDFFSKCDQVRSFLWIWSHLLKRSLMENFIFCAVLVVTLWKCQYCVIWTLKKVFTIASFGRNSRKMSVLFANGMKYRKVCSIVCQ